MHHSTILPIYQEPALMAVSLESVMLVRLALQTSRSRPVMAAATTQSHLTAGAIQSQSKLLLLQVKSERLIRNWMFVNGGEVVPVPGTHNSGGLTRVQTLYLQKIVPEKLKLDLRFRVKCRFGKDQYLPIKKRRKKNQYLGCRISDKGTLAGYNGLVVLQLLKFT